MENGNINFEKSLSELEAIIKKLEDGECSLDESIKLFEQGVRHTDECRKALENAKQKIISLTEAEEEKA